MKPSASSVAAPAVFRVHGELTQPAIAALARLLIDHARRELDEEQRRDDQADDGDHQQRRAEL